MNLNDPVATALLVADALERADLRYALYGGLLLAAYGEPRETHDVDVAVIDVTAVVAQQALAAAGLQSLVSFDDVRFGGLTLGRVALIGGDADTGLNVLDLVRPRSARYSVDALDRSVLVPLRDRQIRALSADDFVVMKTLATRDRDMEDAVTVVKRSGDLLDLDGIEREFARLATEIPDWDAVGRWASIRARAEG